MITKEEARKLIMEKISSNWNIENDEPVILDEFTIEKDFGWVSFINLVDLLKQKYLVIALRETHQLL